MESEPDDPEPRGTAPSAMPLTIEVTTRQRVAYYAPPRPYAVVSITTPGDSEAALLTSPRCLGVLRLSFWDARGPQYDGQHFTPQDARRVWDFVQEHRGRMEALLIHCDAGMSRSPGVASAIDRVLNGDDSRWWRRSRFNDFVRKTMLSVAPASVDSVEPECESDT